MDWFQYMINLIHTRCIERDTDHNTWVDWSIEPESQDTPPDYRTWEVVYDDKWGPVLFRRVGRRHEVPGHQECAVGATYKRKEQ